MNNRLKNTDKKFWGLKAQCSMTILQCYEAILKNQTTFDISGFLHHYCAAPLLCSPMATATSDG